MKTKAPGKVAITVEADTPGALEKLLEQAIFELKLRSMDENGFQQAFTNSAKGEQSGTLGSYSFDYMSPLYDFGEEL